jgi:hypothetical protein
LAVEDARRGKTAGSTCQFGWGPYPSASSNGILSGLAAASPNDVWAVQNGGEIKAQHWDGSSWSTSPLTGDEYLTSVAALTSADVWAAGWYYDTALQKNRTRIDHWDGSAWSVSGSKNAGKASSYLNGVSADASNNIWAVGFSVPTRHRKTLIEHGDGSSWRTAPGHSRQISAEICDSR